MKIQNYFEQFGLNSKQNFENSLTELIIKKVGFIKRKPI